MSDRLGALIMAVALLATMTPPVLAAGMANPDSYSVDEDQTLIVNLNDGVLFNDIPTTPDVTAVLDTPPAQDPGMVLGTDGTFAYTPAANFHGTDTFTYHTVDVVTSESSDVATVTITVIGVNDAGPVALDAPDVACNPGSFGGSFPIPEDAGEFVLLPGPCGLHGTDVDGDELAWELDVDASHGPASVDPDGFATYTPDADYSTPEGDWLSDSFTFRAYDGFVLSSPATMRLWVAPINDAPSFTPGAALVEVDEDSGGHSEPWATDILPGPASESGQAVSFDVEVRPGDFQAFSVQPAISSNGTLTFTPAPDAVWLAQVTVMAHDDGGLEDYDLQGANPDDTSDPAVFEIAIGAIDDAPVTSDQSVSATEDVMTAINLTATDEEGDPTTFVVADPEHGSVGMGPWACFGVPSSCTQVVNYAPDANYVGTDSFTYTVTDGTTTSAAATVSIMVAGTPDAPVAANDPLAATEDAGVVVIDPRINDSDADGNSLAVTAVTQGTKGAVTFTAGSVRYAPALNAFGADSFTYSIDDGTGRSDTATVTVTITGVNDPPTIGQPWRLFAFEDAGPTARKVRTVLAAGPGEGTQTLSAQMTVNSNPSLFGSPPVLTVTPTGLTVAFTPAANRNGRAVISFVVKDNGGTTNGGQNTSVVRFFVITVAPVNDPPNAVNDLSFRLPRNAAATALAVLANDTAAPDSGETLTITAKTNGAHGAVAITAFGTGLTYRPATGFSGTDIFTYTVSDGHGGTDTATVLVTVNP